MGINNNFCTNLNRIYGCCHFKNSGWDRIITARSLCRGIAMSENQNTQNSENGCVLHFYFSFPL